MQAFASTEVQNLDDFVLWGNSARSAAIILANFIKKNFFPHRSNSENGITDGSSDKACWIGAQPGSVTDLLTSKICIKMYVPCHFNGWRYCTHDACSGPRQGAPAGSGPMREVATELLKLLITPDIFSITPSGRYQSILPQDALGLSRSREARLTAAGFACLFHIVWTGAGPIPISPFLLFSLITESHDQLLHPSFLRHLDDDGDAHRYDDYFNAIGAVRDRLASGELPLLAPFQDHIMNYHQLMVSPEIIRFMF
jgi:hypothetical protein